MNASRVIFAGLAVVAVATSSLVRAGEIYPQGAVEVVARMYRDQAWEAVIDVPQSIGKPLMAEPVDVLKRFFTKELAELIHRDRLCTERTHEVCKINFSPIWASQDPGAAGMKIFLGKAVDTVNVKFRYPGDSSTIEIMYRLRQTKRGWRITDINYQDGSSLVAMLK